jgi:enamine deaminase RidA (YjgF/YER057c/UK114 family)
MGDRKDLRLGKPLEDKLPFSLGVVSSGRFLHTAGITARDRDGEIVGVGDIVAQTRQCYENIGDILAAAGAGWGDVIKYLIFTTDIQAFSDQTRELRAKYYVNRPAATLVEVSRLADPRMMVEIEAIVSLPEEAS